MYLSNLHKSMTYKLAIPCFMEEPKEISTVVGHTGNNKTLPNRMWCFGSSKAEDLRNSRPNGAIHLHHSTGHQLPENLHGRGGLVTCRRNEYVGHGGRARHKTTQGPNTKIIQLGISADTDPRPKLAMDQENRLSELNYNCRKTMDYSEYQLNFIMT